MSEFAWRPTRCAGCGGELPAQHGRGRARKFCSDACRREAEREAKRSRYRDQRRAELGERVCVVCRRPLAADASRRQILCGRSYCRDQRYAALHPGAAEAKVRRKLERRAERKRAVRAKARAAQRFADAAAAADRLARSTSAVLGALEALAGAVGGLDEAELVRLGRRLAPVVARFAGGPR